MNNKRYELKDHLGNVRATFSDVLQTSVAQLGGNYTFSNYKAAQKSMYNYYAFGSPKPNEYNTLGVTTQYTQYYEANDNTNAMPSTAFNYRFGFNGQEKDNDIAGIGNHNTAKFWEYDTRLGRRWNLDPVDQISISNYACFSNNPILFTDILGDHVYAVNSFGYINLVRETKDETDLLIVSDRKIEKLRNQSTFKGGMTLSKGILDKLVSKDGHAIGTFKNKQGELTRLFNFLADNTAVEWSLTNYTRTENPDKDVVETNKMSMLSTDHEREEESTGATVTRDELSKDNEVTDIEHTHNHPRKIWEDGMNNEHSDGDKTFYDEVQKNNPNSKFYIREKGETKQVL